MKEETNTEHTQAPEQPLLPGMEEAPVRTGSDSDWDPRFEDLAEENEVLKHEIRMRDAVDQVKTRLAQFGAKSPRLLTDRSKESFQFSDEGSLTNAEAIVEHLRKAYPEQFSAGSIDATAGRMHRPTVTKESLARMTPAEIQQLDWAEVRSALQGN